MNRLAADAQARSVPRYRLVDRCHLDTGAPAPLALRGLAVTVRTNRVTKAHAVVGESGAPVPGSWDLFVTAAWTDAVEFAAHVRALQAECMVVTLGEEL